MQSILQAVTETMLEPIYQVVEQVRFFSAVVINAIVAICFAQTLENRATALSRAIYLLILWATLPVALGLVNAFYKILGFSSRESMAEWAWLIIPAILAMLCAAYAAALLLAWRKKKRNILDVLLFAFALFLMVHRTYQHYS